MKLDISWSYFVLSHLEGWKLTSMLFDKFQGDSGNFDPQNQCNQTFQTYGKHENEAANRSCSTDNASIRTVFFPSSLDQDEYCKYFLVGYCPGKTLGREIESVLVSAIWFFCSRNSLETLGTSLRCWKIWNDQDAGWIRPKEHYSSMCQTRYLLKEIAMESQTVFRLTDSDELR